jgi:hypothetical protein
MRGPSGLFSHKIPLRLVPACIQDSRLVQLRLSLTGHSSSCSYFSGLNYRAMAQIRASWKSSNP